MSEKCGMRKHVTTGSVSQITPKLIQKYVFSGCVNLWVGVPPFNLKPEIERLVFKGGAFPFRLKIKQVS